MRMMLSEGGRVLAVSRFRDIVPSVTITPIYKREAGTLSFSSVSHFRGRIFQRLWSPVQSIPPSLCSLAARYKREAGTQSFSSVSQIRGRICKRLWSPVQSIPPSLCSLAGRYERVAGRQTIFFFSFSNQRPYL